MANKWIKLPSVSPVQDSIVFAAELEKAGRQVTRLNQGAEETVPSKGALAELREYGGAFAQGYNKDAGGAAEMRARPDRTRRRPAGRRRG